MAESSDTTAKPASGDACSKGMQEAVHEHGPEARSG